MVNLVSMAAQERLTKSPMSCWWDSFLKVSNLTISAAIANAFDQNTLKLSRIAPTYSGVPDSLLNIAGL